MRQFISYSRQLNRCGDSVQGMLADAHILVLLPNLKLFVRFFHLIRSNLHPHVDMPISIGFILDVCVRGRFNSFPAGNERVSAAPPSLSSHRLNTDFSDSKVFLGAWKLHQYSGWAYSGTQFLQTIAVCAFPFSERKHFLLRDNGLRS